MEAVDPWDDNVILTVLSLFAPLCLLSHGLVQKRWLDISSNNLLWQPLCDALWEGKVHVSPKARDVRMPRKTSYFLSLREGKKLYITQEELESFEWSFRFKESAGLDWIANCRWHKGKKASLVRFDATGVMKILTSRILAPNEQAAEAAGGGGGGSSSEVAAAVEPGGDDSSDDEADSDFVEGEEDGEDDGEDEEGEDEEEDEDYNPQTLDLRWQLGFFSALPHSTATNRQKMRASEEYTKCKAMIVAKMPSTSSSLSSSSSSSSFSSSSSSSLSSSSPSSDPHSSDSTRRSSRIAKSAVVEPIGSNVQVWVNGIPAPTYKLFRSPTQNWGYILESCWCIYTSWEMPLRGECPELEMERVKLRSQEREVDRYNEAIQSLGSD